MRMTATSAVRLTYSMADATAMTIKQFLKNYADSSTL